MTSSKAAANLLLLTLSIAAGLLAVQCTNRPGASTSAARATRTCVSGATHLSDRFAMVHGYITYSAWSEIWAVDPNHPASQISLGPSNGMTPIAWSRDGNHLLLMQRDMSLTGPKQDLYVMNADGSQTRLTCDGLSGAGSFSPDGTKVVISRQDDGLYVVDVKGRAPRLIAKSHGAWWLESPAWSPDGSRIAYAVYEELGPEGMAYEIWTVNPDGTDPRQLVDLGACGTPAGCTGGLAWSPDGSMLAFHSQRGWLIHYPTDRLPNQEIFVVHADGSGLHRISEDGAQPSWSPDGSRIACVRNNGDVVTMAADGTSVIPVEGVAARRLAWNPVGRT